MTYTSTNDQWKFFVVGGNSDGTENGRIYFYRYFSLQNEFLYDYATASNQWCSWDVSKWTDDTMLVLTPNGYEVTDLQASRVGVSSLADLHTLGFDGSKLFTGVKIL